LVESIETLGPRRRAEAPFHLLVFGGSQGARQINEGLIGAAPRLASEPIEIFHQAGAADRDRVSEAYDRAGVKATVVDFEPNMPERYRWADLAISRSGALSVLELSLAGLPALLVPYPWAADDHQTANARELERAGAAELLPSTPDHHLEPSVVADAVTRLFSKPEALQSMSDAAGKLARPRAAEDVVEECLGLVQ
jgi:UDP-N-acetylglucosamine--N-acetylmuramyl-(pentapeptide) pyrophosphoryl-undecaprenol N-acetylglucosamine transferase